eukprot:TRINITY_DN9967_c0_g1_i5.p1 TRINITY_DN9967_c0_g1~~TRINITY_DN9967_c0_g1_i5.p1  ORF type:complete len:527 (-),score=142.18 TRINITY_DN9967_c0_g1_i5:289-1869(-)
MLRSLVGSEMCIRDRDWRSRLYTPKLLLWMLSIINVLNYCDRYLITGVLDDLQSGSTDGANVPAGGCNITSNGTTRHFDRCLTSSQQGLIASIFMIGFLVGSPIFAILVKWCSSAKLLFCSLLLWCGAVLLTGSTSNYYVLLCARGLSGIGEAAFGCIAPPFINKIAPPDRKGVWLAIYFCGVPIGSALGIGSGGFASAAGAWRVPFFVEACAMVPLALLCYWSPIGRRSEKRAARIAATTAVHESTMDKLLNHLTVFRNSRYMLMVFGYAAFTWCIGGLVLWSIKFIQNVGIQSNKTSASFTMGGITAVAGLLGTVLGGTVLDKFSAGKDPRFGGYVVAAKLSAGFVAVGLPLLVVTTELTNPIAFYAVLFLGLTDLLTITTIANAALMWCTEPHLQEFAMAMCTVTTHLCGDVISNVVMGAVCDAAGGQHSARAWRWSFYSGEAGLVPCIALWGMAAVVGQKYVDSRTPVDRMDVSDDLKFLGIREGSEPSSSFSSSYDLDDNLDENTKLQNLSEAKEQAYACV